MLLKDNTKRRPKKHERVSARKHEGVRNPTARNAVVKVPGEGYQARVDADRDADIASMRLRINALELEVSRLKRDGAVDAGYAAPLAEATGNVIPMSVARKARAEKESAVPASQPLPVAGNEAQVLPSPSTEPAPEPRRGNYEPSLVGKVNTLSGGAAANDEDVGRKEAADSLTDISDSVSVDDVATLAEGYGMTLEEASEILYREYSKRELHCYHTHGESREVVRLERHIAKHTKCLPGGYVQVARAKSGFSDWWNETESRMKILRANSAAREAAEYRSPAHHVPLVKGEAKYRRKQFLKARAAARTPDRAAIGRIQDISRKLYVGGKVTTASQTKAIGTMLFGGYQRVRKLLGMQPTVRNNTARVRAEVVADMEASHSAALQKKEGIVPAAIAEELSMRELVRRYQRAGIV